MACSITRKRGHMEFVGTCWALVPPIVAIVLALITKETYSSLFVGILVGALLLAQFNPVDTINYMILGEIGEGEDAMGVGFINAISDPWNAGIFIFLVMLGIMVALVNVAGGSAAFGRWEIGRASPVSAGGVSGALENILRTAADVESYHGQREFRDAPRFNRP